MYAVCGCRSSSGRSCALSRRPQRRNLVHQGRAQARLVPLLRSPGPLLRGLIATRPSRYPPTIPAVSLVEHTSFGTRGSQVQILPLRPAFSSLRSTYAASYAERNTPGALSPASHTKSATAPTSAMSKSALRTSRPSAMPAQREGLSGVRERPAVTFMRSSWMALCVISARAGTDGCTLI